MYKITEAAVAMMKEMVSERKDKNLLLTICSSGVGCGGSSLKVDMRRGLSNYPDIPLLTLFPGGL